MILLYLSDVFISGTFLKFCNSKLSKRSLFLQRVLNFTDKLKFNMPIRLIQIPDSITFLST